jgi:hypothetical protein
VLFIGFSRRCLAAVTDIDNVEISAALAVCQNIGPYHQTPRTGNQAGPAASRKRGELAARAFDSF